MKKIFTLFAVSIGLIGIIIGYGANNTKIATTNVSQQKDRLETIKEKGVLTFASANDPPFAYINHETKRLDGVDAHIIMEIAKRLGINKVERKEMPFADLLEKLNTDDSIDLAANGIYITPEREVIISFTKPLYRDSEAVVVPKASKINNKNDLKNAVVGAEKGTKFADLIQEWKKNNLIKDVVILKDIPELLDKLNNGGIDAAVSDSVAVKYALKDKKFFLKTLRDYTAELNGITGIAVKKNDTTLLNSLNEKIDEMKADGTLYVILVDNGFDKDNMIVSMRLKQEKIFALKLDYINEEYG